MPTYEYRCTGCGAQFEAVQKITDDPLKTCPACGKSVERLINAANFILKGNGWYKTDYSTPDASRKDEGGSCSADKTAPQCQGCPAKAD